MWSAGRLLLVTLVVLFCGCSELPTIRAGECGNGVIDRPAEDCDTLPPYPGAVCRAQNTLGECHLDCRLGSDGTRPACPTGWGCDRDELCREPSGVFDPAATFRVGGAASLLAADFDGDGRGEVISGNTPNALGQALFRVHYFDGDGLLAETRTFGRKISALQVAELSRDARSDIVFAQRGVGLILGQVDRSLVPETFSPYLIPGSPLRLVSLIAGPIQGQFAMVILTVYEGRSGLHVVDGASRRLSWKGELYGPMEQLAGEPTSGQFDERASSPCRELVHAFLGASSFHVSDLCERERASGALVWRELAEHSTVALEPPAGITTAARVGDLDGDGHSDVMIGTSSGTYVAYGDGERLRAAVPYRLPLPSASDLLPDTVMPLALGDFSGDGRVDFVLPDRLLVSRASSAFAPAAYLAHRNTSAPWSAAAIADLNGNGKVDVAASSREGPGVDFFSGTGSPVLVPTQIATAGPVTLLGTGDFDGDALGDLVFVEKAQSSERPDAVWMAYGAAHETPSEPKLAARIRNVEHLALHEGSDLLTLVELSSSEPADGARRGVSTFLFGSPERAPLTTFDLIPFAGDGSLRDHPALALTAGAFRAEQSKDVLALASDQAYRAFSFWLLGSVSVGREPLAQLADNLDPRLEPLEHTAAGVIRRQVESTSADLDGDSHDEAIWVMPADQRQRCGVLITAVSRAPLVALVARAPLLLELPCLDPQVAAVDADGDARPDIALLTGARAAGDRQLLVLWNDGFGNFAASNLTVVNTPGNAPQAFASLPSSPTRPFSFAYVSASALLIASAAPTPRTFAAAQLVAPLQRGTGIVALDVTGDGVSDLVVADAGDLSVFRAQWRPK